MWSAVGSYGTTTEARVGNRFLLTAKHYDNRTDPTIFEAGQCAWTTRFDDVSLAAE